MNHAHPEDDSLSPTSSQFLGNRYSIDLLNKLQCCKSNARKENRSLLNQGSRCNDTHPKWYHYESSLTWIDCIMLWTLVGILSLHMLTVIGAFGRSQSAFPYVRVHSEKWLRRTIDQWQFLPSFFSSDSGLASLLFWHNIGRSERASKNWYIFESLTRTATCTKFWPWCQWLRYV